MARETPLFVDDEVIRITRDGVWLSNGAEITHEEQVRAFSRHLGRDDQGWYVRIGRDFKRIEVDDTAYFVTRVDGAPGTGYELTLSDGARERLDPATLAYREGRLTCTIARGGTNEEARFLHGPYLELLRNVECGPSGYRLRIQRTEILLGGA